MLKKLFNIINKMTHDVNINNFDKYRYIHSNIMKDIIMNGVMRDGLLLKNAIKYQDNHYICNLAIQQNCKAIKYTINLKNDIFYIYNFIMCTKNINILDYIESNIRDEIIYYIISNNNIKLIINYILLNISILNNINIINLIYNNIKINDALYTCLDILAEYLTLKKYYHIILKK